MEISKALAADLALLTEALDEPGISIVDTVRQLAVDVGLAVRSFLGLTVFASGSGPWLTFSVMADRATHGDVRASLMMPLTQLARAGGETQIAVILYAAKAGALVDLAADLAWLIGCELGDLVVDQHMDRHPDRSVGTASVINQALGVLFGRGLTPQQADSELGTRAAAAGTDRHAIAAGILADLGGDRPDADEDRR